jgi:hypothetical protein
MIAPTKRTSRALIERKACSKKKSTTMACTAQTFFTRVDTLGYNGLRSFSTELFTWARALAVELFISPVLYLHQRNKKVARTARF